MSASKPAKQSSRNRSHRDTKLPSSNTSIRYTMTPPQRPSLDRGVILRMVSLAAFVAALLIGYHFLRAARQTALVVYCAHDSIYAEQIFKSFEQETGIPVEVRYDTEATKSLGLM